MRVAVLIPLLAGLAATHRPLRAQQPGGRLPGLVVSGGGRVASLAGHTALLPGGGLLLQLGPRVAVGGVAWALPTNLHLGRPDIDLGFGYGGIVLRLQPLRSHDALGVGVLVGALNAVVRDAVVGTEIDADNALVVAPELEAGTRVGHHVRLVASADWRLVWGVDPLPGVTAADLRGWGLGLSLRLGPF